MNLEEKKVLLSRWNIVKEWHNKEWWYTGIYDPDLKIYLSFFFVRINLIDQFSFTLFDLKIHKPLQFDKKLYLEKRQTKGRLCLNYHSGNITLEYNGDEIDGWKFKFKNREYHIELDMKPTLPAFTKFDNEFARQYTLLQHFNILTSGFIKIPDKEYKIQDALCYYDHCFGTVPSKTGWHWIAVQNRDVSLNCLKNYGPYAQKYTQIYFNQSKHDFYSNRWIRLSQDVSFEYPDPSNKFLSDWQVTSPDLELTVTPMMYTCKVDQIPPLIPFLIRLTHCEIFVKASGRVRVDGQWLEVKDLYGIMEEHFGKW